MKTIKGNNFTYPAFLSWVEQLVAEGKSSGELQSTARIQFTSLNLHRMKRIDKTIQLNQELIALSQNTILQKWVLITETWCGDSAQNLAVIGKIAEHSQGKIKLEIILRDQNPEWLEKYHTNGSHSIPKLIAFDKNENELFTWGPRPAPAQELLKQWKTNPQGKTWDDFEKELHTWYAKDKTQTLQYEFAALLKSYENKNTKPLSDFDFVVFNN
ncbi:MAG: thioredoxin family protein [Bacteroidia bacterium]